MLKFYTLITGDEFKNIENETPQSKKKIRLLAICVQIPVIMWAVQSYLLSSEVLKCDKVTSLVVMIICTALIFILEKIIVMSNGSKMMAAFRISLGLIIALIGSIALDEVVFKNDIDVQFIENKRAYLNKNMDLKKNDLNKEINSLKENVKVKEEKWLNAYNNAVGEYDGTTGSGIPGNGKRTSLKMQMTDEMKLKYESAKNEFDEMKVKSDSTLNSYQDFISNKYNENSLLLRIEAMFDLILKDGWMMFVYILFTLLIIILESTVIIAKLCSSETNYERKMKLIEKIGEGRMNEIQKSKSAYFDTMTQYDQVKGSIEKIRMPLNGILN